MPDPLDIPSTIRSTAQQYGVDPDLAVAIAQQGEGSGQFLSDSAVSPKGAVGVMQLMPDTAKGLGVDPSDRAQNITGGVRYLRQLQDQFGADHPDLIAAAYNAGPAAVSGAGGVPRIAETQGYVSRVTGALQNAPPGLGDVMGWDGSPASSNAAAPTAPAAPPASADSPPGTDEVLRWLGEHPGPAAPIPPVQKTALPPAELAPGSSTRWGTERPGADFTMTPDVMRLPDGNYRRAGPSGDNGAWQGGDVAISPVTGQFQVLSPQDALDLNRPGTIGPARGPSPLMKVDAFGRNLANTLTGGWADKIQAAFDAHDEASFSAELDRQKRLDAIRQNQAPVTSAFAGLTGLAGQAFLTPELRADTFAGSTANNAALGAGYGALQGSGNARGNDWWNQTGTGAAGGALFGLGLSAAAKPASMAFSGLKNAASPYLASAFGSVAERQAGERLAGYATDLPATRNALEGTGVIVPGSQPTTFQQTGDMGIGAAERGARVNNPEPFKQREADQNAARVAALKSIQTGADPAAVGNFVSGELERIDNDTQAAIDSARQTAQAKGAAIGGTGTPEGYGADLRSTIADAEASARQREGSLWAAIDPEGKLTGNVSATVQAAKDIQAGIPATAKPPTGEEAAIYDAAAGMNPLSPVSDLIALRSRVSTAMRQELIANGRSPTYARLAQMRGALQGNLANTISDAIQSGPQGAGNTILGGIRSYADQYLGGPATGRNVVSAVAGGDIGPSANGGRAGGVPGVAGAGSTPPRGPSGAPGVAGLPQDAVAQARADLAFASLPTGNLFGEMQKLGGLKVWGPDGKPLPGVDVGGAMGDARFPPGAIDNVKGLPPEQMAQALADRGFFGPNVANPSRAFEDALTQAGRGGQKVFGAGVNDADQAAVRAQIQREAQEAGVSAGDSASAAATKLASYRAAVSDLRSRATSLGIPNPEAMAPEDLWAEVREREGIQGETGPAPQAQGPDHGAEFDRLSGRAPTFDEAAAARLQAATAATKERAATFGLRPVATVTATQGQQGLYRLADGAVAGKFFHSGPTGFNDVQAAIKAGGDQAQGALEDYAASNLRQAAGNADGTIDPKRFATWQAKNADALRALGPDVQARFADAASAGQAVADAAASRAAALKAVKSGALGKFIGVSDPDAVTRVVGGILRSPTAADQIGAIADATRSNPQAFQGFRQAIADHISDTLIGNTEAGTSGVGTIKADAYQTFVNTNRAALSKVFSPSEMDTMDAIAADIQQANRSNTALKFQGSNTTQDTGAGAKFVRVASKASLDLLGAIVGGSFGGLEGGALGVTAAHTVGASVVEGLQQLRAAGINRVNDLVTQALLDPAVARRLLAKVPDDPAAQQSALQGLANVLRKGLIGAAPATYQAAQPKRINMNAFGQVVPQRSAAPANALAGIRP